MSKTIKLSGDGAVWDFSKVSRKWHKAFAKSIREASKAGLLLSRPAPIGDDEAMRAHLDAQAGAMDAMEQYADEQQALIAQVLVSVPDSWLSSGAPDDLDYSDPESLDWLMPDRYAELLRQVQTGEAWASDSGN